LRFRLSRFRHKSVDLITNRVVFFPTVLFVFHLTIESGNRNKEPLDLHFGETGEYGSEFVQNPFRFRVVRQARGELELLFGEHHHHALLHFVCLATFSFPRNTNSKMSDEQEGGSVKRQRLLLRELNTHVMEMNQEIRNRILANYQDMMDGIHDTARQMSMLASACQQMRYDANAKGDAAGAAKYENECRAFTALSQELLRLKWAHSPLSKVVGMRQQPQQPIRHTMPSSPPQQRQRVYRSPQRYRRDGSSPPPHPPNRYADHTAPASPHSATVADQPPSRRGRSSPGSDQ
jgi:hypothetical protein